METDSLGHTIYQAAAFRLDEMIRRGAEYSPVHESRFATADQLRRALVEDLDETALAEFRLFHRAGNARRRV